MARVPRHAPRRAAARTPDLQSVLDAHKFVLLYDGVCALCNSVVRFVLDRDKDGSMRFAPLDSDFARAALRRLPELEGVDSVVLLHRDGAWVRSAAAIEIARYIGGIWSLGVLGYVIPRRWRDALYDAVARRRYQRYGKLDACPVPAPEVRKRFIAF